MQKGSYFDDKMERRSSLVLSQASDSLPIIEKMPPRKRNNDELKNLSQILIALK
jgi:hypothetical protein